MWPHSFRRSNINIHHSLWSRLRSCLLSRCPFYEHSRHEHGGDASTRTIWQGRSSICNVTEKIQDGHVSKKCCSGYLPIGWSVANDRLRNSCSIFGFTAWLNRRLLDHRAVRCLVWLSFLLLPRVSVSFIPFVSFLERTMASQSLSIHQLPFSSKKLTSLKREGNVQT